MNRRDVYLLRDGMSVTPVAANLMLTVLACSSNGASRAATATTIRRSACGACVKSGAQPWSEEAYRFVMDKAPAHLADGLPGPRHRAAGERPCAHAPGRPGRRRHSMSASASAATSRSCPAHQGSDEGDKVVGRARSRLLPHLGVGQAMHGALSEPALGHLARRAGSGAAQRRQTHRARAYAPPPSPTVGVPAQRTAPLPTGSACRWAW